MADLTQVAASTRDTIGRYFSLVSAVPSAILVAWTVLLVGSGAWTGPPDVAMAARSFDVGLGGGIGLVLATVFLGVVLHPLQYSFVQFLEGYWGDGRVLGPLRRYRSAAYWKYVLAVRNELAEVEDRIADAELRGTAGLDVDYDALDRDRVIRAGLTRVERTFPRTADEMMPTRLGNVLRVYERSAGASYEIESNLTIPYVLRVAPPADVEYVNDQRSLLDLSARMTIVSTIATALAAAFLARHGLWLLIALAPYASVYLSYRGTLVAAAEYGRALGVVLTLNRFALYDRLELRRPESTVSERIRNATLMPFLDHRAGPNQHLAYRDPPSPAQ